MMEFSNTFTVGAPLVQVWELLMQPEEVTACVPGTAITEKIDDRHFKGTIKVKLGAVQVSYRGELEMQPDEATHTIVLSGKGSEARGSGGAAGTMTVSLSPDEKGTQVTVNSQVDVTGRVATFGRGIMQDVANRLTKQFASCLADKLSESPASDESAQAAEAGAGEVNDAAAPAATGGMTSEARVGAPGPSRAPVQTSQPTSGTSNELRVVDILADIARARTAALLRSLAAWIEPK
jgi:carbon monoxide dehydrogenase subunit G